MDGRLKTKMSAVFLLIEHHPIDKLYFAYL